MKILIADDEEADRAIYSTFLKSEGNEVIVTSDGKECLETYEKALKECPADTNPFDLVLLDYRMPFVDGGAVAKGILGTRSAQKIFIATAYPAELFKSTVPEDKVRVIQKPFDMEQFVTTIRDTDVQKDHKNKHPASYHERDNAEEWNNKGIKFGMIGQHDKALGCFERALRINPNYGKAWYNKGTSLGKMGRLDKDILTCFEKTLEIDPNHAAAWNNRGALLAKQGRNKEALASYDRAIEIDPLNAKAWYNKGLVLERMGNKKNAKECMKKSVQLALT